jgi:hypothetical protein
MALPCARQYFQCLTFIKEFNLQTSPGGRGSLSPNYKRETEREAEAMSHNPGLLPAGRGEALSSERGRETWAPSRPRSLQVLDRPASEAGSPRGRWVTEPRQERSEPRRWGSSPSRPGRQAQSLRLREKGLQPASGIYVPRAPRAPRARKRPMQPIGTGRRGR